MNDNEVGRALPVSQGEWQHPDPASWMTFNEAVAHVRASHGADDETAISTIISRANDGIVDVSASRTELIVEIPGEPPTRREFNIRDGKYFLEMLHSAFHGSPCPAIQEAETLKLSNANFFTGDFKFLVECKNPHYEVFLFVWGLVLNRRHIEATFLRDGQVPRLVPMGSAPAKRPGRKKGSGSLAMADAPLLAEMRDLIRAGRAHSADGAAKIIAPKAPGGGTVESKATRLANRYRASEENGE